MNKRQKQLSIIAITMSVVSLVSAASFSNENKNDARDVEAVKVSLIQAVQKAQSRVSGKTVRASLEKQRARLQWEVEIVSNHGVYDVLVDANSGSVLSTQVDKQDREKEDSED